MTMFQGTNVGPDFASSILLGLPGGFHPPINPSNTLSRPVENQEYILPQKLREKINIILGLKENWDGHMGKPIHPESILFGLRLMMTVQSGISPVMPQIVPASYGGVQIEWHSKKGDLEVEIIKPFDFEVFYENAETNEFIELEGKNDFTKIKELLARL
ncbi:MAG: hypothetical protein OEW12_03135 [Deltaproteobacteria bacterium]|nr:hypothetical protein [Deltaproteobacteria bacterium]